MTVIDTACGTETPFDGASDPKFELSLLFFFAFAQGPVPSMVDCGTTSLALFS